MDPATPETYVKAVDPATYETYVKAVTAAEQARDELVEVGRALLAGEPPPKTAQEAVEHLREADSAVAPAARAVYGITGQT